MAAKLEWQQKWAVRELEAGVFEAVPIQVRPAGDGFIVRLGCLREVLTAQQVYDTEQAAKARVRELASAGRTVA